MTLLVPLRVVSTILQGGDSRKYKGGILNFPQWSYHRKWSFSFKKGALFTSPFWQCQNECYTLLTELTISSELSAITHRWVPRVGGRLNKEIKMAVQWKYSGESRWRLPKARYLEYRLNWKNGAESSDLNGTIWTPRSRGSESISIQFWHGILSNGFIKFYHCLSTQGNYLIIPCLKKSEEISIAGEMWIAFLWWLLEKAEALGSRLHIAH